jgi:plastocyanin
MNRGFGVCVAGLLLVITAGCGPGEPDATSALPPAPENSAAIPTDGSEINAVVDGGTIAGTIIVSGSIPTLPPRQTGRDPEVCGTGNRPSERLFVNSAGGLRNAVVIVEGVSGGKPMPAEVQNAQLEQNDCDYAPHLTVMAANSDIGILNNDPTLHNVQFFQGNDTLFNIAQPVQGQVNSTRVENTGFIDVECAVHGWMSASVVVVDNPYFAVTDENGEFSITDLPAGTYQVKIWHEYLGEETREITVTGGVETTLDLDLESLLAELTAPAPDITSNSASPGDGGAAAGEVIVEMLVADAGTTFGFEPADITIPVGTTVRWVNHSDPRHTSTGDPDWETPQTPVILPPGAMIWRTPFLRTDDSATHTFTVPGEYQYFCETHGPYGMIGTITVVP